MSYFRTIPGILKLITVTIGIIAVIVGFSTNSRPFAGAKMKNIRFDKISKKGFDCLPGNFMAIYFVAMSLICLVLSAANLVYHFQIVDYTRFTRRLRMVDSVYHALGGFLLLVGGALMLVYIILNDTCFSTGCNKDNDKCLTRTRAYIKYEQGLAAGVFGLLNAILYFVLVIVILVLPAPVAPVEPEEMQSDLEPPPLPANPQQLLPPTQSASSNRQHIAATTV